MTTQIEPSSTNYSTTQRNKTMTNNIAAQAQYDNEKKSEGVAYALWFFLGALGGHRFYAGNIGMGVAMFLTLGGLGVWALIDVFFIGKAIKRHNRDVQARIFA